MEYHTVYKTTNLWNDKFYIGLHSTKNLEDGYIGSGREFREAVNEFGRFFLNKEILYFCHNREIARSIEKELIVEALTKSPEDCYNLTTRLGGGNYGSEGRYGEDNPFYGKKHSYESLKKMSDSLKEHNFNGERNPFYGKKHKAESIEAANKKREENGTYYIDKNPNRLKALYKKEGVWWCTPKASFHSASAAATHLGVGKACIRNRCKWGDDGKIAEGSRVPVEWRGRSWKDIGYYTLPRKGHDMKSRKTNVY